MTQPSTEVAVYAPPTAGELISQIDIAREKQQLDKFRDFIHGVLDPEKGHYGKMPGVKRDFLQQPGAEIIYRAMQARPKFTIENEQIVWAEKLCYYRVKCQVVHIETGTVLGEAEGAASSLEYAANCTFQATGPGMVDCPMHGQETPRMDWDPSVRGKKIPFCSGKNPQGLDRTLQNVLAKANKRAMVAAIRTLGCVSEMFSQDSDLMDGGRDDNRDDGPPSRPQPAQPKAQSGPKTSTAKTKPAPAAQGEAPPAASSGTTDGFSITEIKAAMAALKESLDMTQIRAFFEDAGFLEVGAAMTAAPLTGYCKAKRKSLADMVADAVERFMSEPEGEVVEGEFTEAPAPEAPEPVENVDDIQFE